MEQYISKSALVAEIRNKVDSYKGDGIISVGVLKQHCEDFIYSLDTLEVKEVNLDKEVDDYINEHFSECDDGVLISDANSMELTLLDITPLAKHFFELGMAVSNKAQKREEV